MISSVSMKIFALLCVCRLGGTLPSVQAAPSDVHVFARKSNDESKLNLICVATGFYPKDVKMNIRKYRTSLPGDEIESSGIKPDHDGSFQMRKSVVIKKDEKADYECFVFHKSIKQPIVIKWDGKCWDCPSVTDSSMIGVVIEVVIGAVLALAIFALVVFALKKRIIAFVCTNPPKVLLKRGQPPLPCMLLGGTNGGDATPRLPLQEQEVRPVGRAQGWTGHGEMSVGIGCKGSGWGEDQEVEATCRREGMGWNQGGGSEWTTLPEGGGWKEERGSDSKNQDESGQRSGGWGGNGGGSVKQHQGWGEKPNKQTALKTQNQQPQQQLQTQQQMPGYPKALQDRGRPGEPDDQSKGSGWTCVPIPQTPSVVEPTGWEEPSPPSIRRKMEIDDGKSAWGDPSHYNKYINLWDKNSAPAQQQSSGRQPGTASKNSAPATWARSSGPSDPSVDSGAVSWGKPCDAPSGWGESNEPGKGGGWGEPDPYMTPAGMMGSAVLGDTEHHLLQDNTDRWLHPEDDLSAARPPADLSPRPDAGQRSDSLQ